jgi:predicted ATPase
MWKEVQAGERRVAMVAGEPGIGKTRLVGELAVAAHDEGAVVLYGRCQEQVGLPYQAFAEALRGYVAACPLERLRQQVGPLGGDLVRLVPTLPDRIPDLPEPVRAEPETERYRLFEGVAGLLNGISAAAPVVVVLDDLHVAARPDLALLRHLLRPGESGRIFFVGTYRDIEVDHDHVLGRPRPRPRPAAGFPAPGARGRAHHIGRARRGRGRPVARGGLGREFDVSLLMEASGVQADAVLDALERAEHARS